MEKKSRSYGNGSIYYQLFLDHTGHYIFLSTCLVYDDKEQPIKETSPRLWDTSEDEALKASHDYCIHKAQDEDLLARSPYHNWTVVRPATTFSTVRLQLVTLEFKNNVARALLGKKWFFRSRPRISPPPSAGGRCGQIDCADSF